MKIDFKNKFTYYAGCLLTALIGICLIFCSFFPEDYFGEGTALFSLKPLLSLIFGAVLLSFALYLFLIPRKIKKIGNEAFLIQQTSSGVLRISKKAIESIVLKCAQQQEDISLLDIETEIKKEEVLVKTTINVAEGASIPTAVDNLQKQVIAQLNNTAGISQTQIIVSVIETTADKNNIATVDTENEIKDEQAEL
ncbi:MAG: hypothetical protein Q4E07_04180 [Eubacteriales bacterium]|nr:hypothetical protein [Eubacteriales bacterium]